MKLLKSDLFGQMTLQQERGQQIVVRDTGAARWWLSWLWMATAKPIYRFVTRRLLGWADREGAGDRRF
jgi:hypothetical protein